MRLECALCAVAQLRRVLAVKAEAVEPSLKDRHIRGINTKPVCDAVYT